MRREFEIGDRGRNEIPDELDPEHQLHGKHGEICGVFEDDGDELGRDVRDAKLYRIKFNSGAEIDFRWRDIRPPTED